MRRKIFVGIMMLCMFWMLSFNVSYAGINLENVMTYERFAEILNGETNKIFRLQAEEDFIWPEEEISLRIPQTVKIDVLTDWEIPENVTIINEGAVMIYTTLEIDGKWIEQGILGTIEGAAIEEATIYVNGTYEFPEGGSIETSYENQKENYIFNAGASLVCGGDLYIGRNCKLTIDEDVMVEIPPYASIRLDGYLHGEKTVLDNRVDICHGYRGGDWKTDAVLSGEMLIESIEIDDGTLTIPEESKIICEYFSSQALNEDDEGSCQIKGTLVVRNSLFLREGEAGVLEPMMLGDKGKLLLLPKLHATCQTVAGKKVFIDGTGEIKVYAEKIEGGYTNKPYLFEWADREGKIGYTNKEGNIAENVSIWWNWDENFECEHLWHDTGIQVLPTCVEGYTMENCSLCDMYRQATFTEPVKVHDVYIGRDWNKLYQQCRDCDTLVSAAYLSVRDGIYTGEPIETAEITFKEGAWIGELPTISYVNNVEIGTATAIISLGEYSANMDFEITVPVLEEKPISGGKWVSDSIGWWYSYYAGGYPVNCWEQINGEWYWFDSIGYMKTGWLKNNNKWYYLSNSGAMVTGWCQISGQWYYMNASGEMCVGWVNDRNTWYYMNDSGAMCTGWIFSGNKWYYLNSSGAMHTGWLQQGKIWYYLKSNGEMATGVLQIDGSMSFFDKSGMWLGYI